MRGWGQSYNPTEMLKLCKVSPFDGANYNALDVCANKITTAIACVYALNHGKSAKEIENLVMERIKEIVEQFSAVSIGRALEKLHSIATTGKELEGGRDGLDALTYHLSGQTCTNGIAALQAVMRRFEEDKKL